MGWHRDKAIRAAAVALMCAMAAVPCAGTSAIALRSRHRIVLAADSRVVYSASQAATECKLFEIGDVYATVSGLAHYGSSYRATDAIREGFDGVGSFQQHLAATANSLQRRTENLLATLQQRSPATYRSVLQKANQPSDFVQLAVAQIVNARPMLGIVELRWTSGTSFNVRTTICPGNCAGDSGIFYLGYWERIRPYVADAGQPRTVASAASIDRLIRMEMNAHPAEVGAPINVLELNSSGVRWLQNGGNCRLPGVG